MSTAIQTRDQRPAREWGTIRHDARELFDRFLGDLNYPWAETDGAPRIDLVESEKTIEATIDVPGFTTDQLDVDVLDNILTVHGDAESKSEKKGERVHLSERRRESFRRSISLPCAIDDDSVEAKLEHGVLTVFLRKADETARRTVPIKG